MAHIPNSILDDSKKLLGIDSEDDTFDVDVTLHVNSAFATLNQIGVGPADGFEISDRNALWVDFLGANKLLNNCKTLVYLMIRLWFDPPTSPADLTAKKEQIQELQWRLNVAADRPILLADGTNGNSGAFMWTLEGENVWPPEAEEGDLGIYPASGNIWRKS